MTRHFLTVDDFSDSELLTLTQPQTDSDLTFDGKRRGLLTCLFQQPSLRTMFSFVSAGVNLGYTPLQLTAGGDKLRDQCELQDELGQLALLSAVVVVRARDPLDLGALYSLPVPFVNAGDGSNEHPTQALVDLMAMRESGFEGKRVLLMGNLRDHRTQHSLAKLLRRFGCAPTLLSPPGMAMPDQYAGELRQVSSSDPAEVDAYLAQADFVYQTPAQFWGSETERAGAAFELNLDRASRVLPSGAKIFHPFPRLGELSRDLDHSPFDAYHAQAARGPLVRTRVLRLLDAA